ncbi:MAG TPA: LysR family transcriptional regulator [Ramlibacter sp.]|nr:LysR family transcriptional regulator [Ramlibacter sp.]
MRHATLRQLQIFTSAATHLSFARAAEELHLSAPAVSIQIAQLEREARVPLFERLGRRLYLTAAGSALLRSSTAIMGQLRAAEEELGALRGVEGGLLNVGVISAGDYFLPTLLAGFCARHRGVQIALSVCNREDLIRRLDHNLVDLAIMSQRPDGEDFAYVPFAAHPIIIVAAAAHRLAAARRIPLSALAKEPFIAREHGSLTRVVMDETLRRARIKPAIAIEASSNETVKQSVAAGFGIAFLSAHAAGLEVQARRLAVLEVAELPVLRKWYAVHRRGKRLPAVAQAFVTHLEKEGAPEMQRLVPPRLRRYWKE